MQRFISRFSKDHVGGGLIILFGLAVAFKGMTYRVGALRSMGPGFFPVALGVLMVLSGTAILVTARITGGQAEAGRFAPEWRAWFCIPLSILAFVVLGKYGGLAPASFAIVFISALADRGNSLKNALVLALAIVVVCTIIFWWALQLQFPLFRWG